MSIAAACLVTALAVAAPPASAKELRTEHGVNRAKLAKKAERVVEERNGVEVRKVSRCGPRRLAGKRRDYSRWICEWRAEGEHAGSVPYHCAGEAHRNRRKRRWRVDPCANRLQPRAALLDSPNPHPTFGFNDDWGAHLRAKGRGFALGVIFRVLAADADVARMNMLWKDVEPVRGGARRWADYDALAVRFHQMGVRPLWVVMGAPCWARPSCDSHAAAPPSAAHVEEFGRFVTAVARRYPHSAGIEVWNEPNYPRFWGGGTPDPDLYAAMLTSAAEQVEQGAPYMPIVSAGLSPHSDNSKDALGYREYLARLYELGAAQRADAIGIHPYPSAGPGEDYLTDARIQIGKVQAEMRRAGHAAPMWATEFGISTAGEHAFAPDAQGRALGELYELFRRVDRIDLAVVHRFVEAPHLGGREAGFGLVGPLLDPKPAFCALAVVRELSC